MSTHDRQVRHDLSVVEAFRHLPPEELAEIERTLRI